MESDRHSAHRLEGRVQITVMVNGDVAKKPAQPTSVPATTRPRGRPPKPGGRMSQVEIQRAYRARLAAAGKVVRVVDAASVRPASASPPMTAIPDFDPAKDCIYERKMIEKMRDDLRNALLKLERREEDVARLGQRNAYLEGALKLQERHHTNALKEIVTLKQQLAKKKPAKRR
jgi:hypothetical protein